MAITFTNIKFLNGGKSPNYLRIVKNHAYVDGKPSTELDSTYPHKVKVVLDECDEIIAVKVKKVTAKPEELADKSMIPIFKNFVSRPYISQNQVKFSASADEFTLSQFDPDDDETVDIGG